jgi:hypothetical protein
MRIVKSFRLASCHGFHQLIMVTVFQAIPLTFMYSMVVSCIDSQSILLVSLASTMKLAKGRGFSGFGNPCRNGFVVSTFDTADFVDKPCLRVRDPDPNEVGAVEPEGIDGLFVVRLIGSAMAYKGRNYMI